jgi:hypothetical protein
MFGIYERTTAEEIRFVYCCYMNTLPFALPYAMDQDRNARARTAFF